MSASSAAAAVASAPVLPPLAPPSLLARRLAHAGLLPFVIGMALTWLLGGNDVDAHNFVTFALSAYAALIITFLGGIHWGFALRQSDPPASLFVWGVSPALVAWVGVLMPPYAGLVVHGTMLVACYLVDRRVYPCVGAASWLTLRFRLSAVAALCCYLGAAGS